MLELPIESPKRYKQHQRARGLVRSLYNKGYKSKCIIQEDVEKKRVYFSECVKVIVGPEGDGFVIKVNRDNYQVIPNYQYFESIDDSERIEIISTDFNGLLNMIRTILNGRKYNKRAIRH